MISMLCWFLTLKAYIEQTLLFYVHQQLVQLPENQPLIYVFFECFQRQNLTAIWRVKPNAKEACKSNIRFTWNIRIILTFKIVVTSDVSWDCKDCVKVWYSINIDILHISYVHKWRQLNTSYVCYTCDIIPRSVSYIINYALNS